MNCERILEMLNDHVDEQLSRPDAERVRSHLTTCADCRNDERELRALLSDTAALPAEIEPHRDLWSGISDRIEGRGSSRSNPDTGWGRALLAASIVIALLGIGYLATRPGDLPADTRADLPNTTPAGEAGPQAAVDTVARPTDGPLRATLIAESALEEAKFDLRQALDEQRASLAPETREMVDRNLLIIEEAIDEIRVALEQDPANPELGRMLIAAHHQEVQLLQRFAQAAPRL